MGSAHECACIAKACRRHPRGNAHENATKKASHSLAWQGWQRPVKETPCDKCFLWDMQWAKGPGACCNEEAVWLAGPSVSNKITKNNEKVKKNIGVYSSSLFLFLRLGVSLLL